MTMRFVLGAAGAGKTHWCLDQICQALLLDPLEGAPLVFLVPEQATFQMERTLLNHHPDITATSRARVVSFSRLAYSIIDEVGGALRSTASEFSNFLTLQTVITRNKDRLRVFGGAAEREGFVQQLSATFHELQAYQYAPKSIGAIGSVLGERSLLGRKLHDIELLYSEYQAFSKARQYRWELPLEHATKLIPAAMQLAGARVWVDGFAGFTPQEYAFLAALHTVAHEVNFSLCIDPQALGSDDPSQWEEGPVEALFHPTLETLIRLKDMAQAKGWAMDPPIMLDRMTRVTSKGSENESVLPRFAAAPLLGKIERVWATDRPNKKAGKSDSDDSVRIIEAPDVRGEVQAVAQEITRLLRDEGYRYRDMAVIVRDLTAYRDTIETVFTEWSFPYFLDVKDPAHHHPLVVFVRAVLDTVLTGFDRDAVFRLLKTDLVPGIERDDVDRLEDFAIRYGLRPKDWQSNQAWPQKTPVRMSANERGAAMEALTRVRDALAPVFAFGRSIDQKNEATNAHYVDALSELLFADGVAETIENWILEANMAGRTSEGSMHHQVLQGVKRLLEEIRQVIGDESNSFAEFCEMINAGLKHLRIAGVPPMVDQILVGAIDRSRQPDLKVVFLVGCNDGVFPAVPSEDALLSDDDRSELSQIGLTLGPTSRLRLFHESYLVYIALTRAKNRIVMTYARTDRGGRPARPSGFITRLMREFPEIDHRSLPARQTPFGWPERGGAIPGWLARALRGCIEQDPQWTDRLDDLKATRDWLAKSGRFTYGAFIPSERAPSAMINPLSALTYANGTRRLPSTLTEILYGNPPVLSPSGLESAAACLFQHFATFGMRLTPRQPFRLDPATLGTISHGTLRNLVERLWSENADWAEVSPERLDQMTQAAFGDALRQMLGGTDDLDAADRFVIDRLEQGILAAGRAMKLHAARGAFRPQSVEVAFGEGRQLPPLKIKLSNDEEVWVVGRIDRVDVARHGDLTYLRVIDYKSSPRAFALDELVYGLDLQLMVYLIAVERAHASDASVRLAGALYVPVFDPLVSVDGPQSVDDLHWLKSLRTSGIILDDAVAPNLMEKDLQGRSELLPLFVKKDGEFGSGSSVADPSHMSLLIDAVEMVVARLADTVMAGNIEIAPYRLANKSPCAYCAIKPVCQFEPGLAGNRYRFLRKEKDGWQMVQQVFEAKHGEGGNRDAV